MAVLISRKTGNPNWGQPITILHNFALVIHLNKNITDYMRIIFDNENGIVRYSNANFV